MVSVSVRRDGPSSPVGRGRGRVDCVRVPHAVRPYADQVVAATDAVCLEHLDVEYAGLCRRVVGKLGRKRPSPLTRGDLGIWAAGVVYVVGQLNFVFDPAQTPHATAELVSGRMRGLRRIEHKVQLADDVHDSCGPIPRSPRVSGEGRFRPSLPTTLRHRPAYSTSKCSRQTASVAATT